MARSPHEGSPPSPIPPDADWRLLERYLAGAATASERDEVERWVTHDATHASLLDSLRALTAASAHARGVDVDTPAARERVHQRIAHVARAASENAAPRSPDSAGTTVPRPTLVAAATASPVRRARAGGTWPRGIGGGAGWRWAAVAASILVGLRVGLTVASGRHRSHFVRAEREYAAAAGQRLSVTLVDGTQLTLAPASRVRLAAEYGRGAREVVLDGEAYFAVVHDAAHPFAVRARGAVARDVGTAFDVRAYPEDAGARIAVAAGAVTISTVGRCRSGLGAGGCGAQMHAGDVATVVNGNVAVEHDISVASLTGWMQGRLAFDNTPMPEVMRELARTFDLRITLADSGLTTQRITGLFDNESVDEVLDDVAGLVGGQYEREGRLVVIKRRGPGVRRRELEPRTPLTTAEARGASQ